MVTVVPPCQPSDMKLAEEIYQTFLFSGQKKSNCLSKVTLATCGTFEAPQEHLSTSASFLTDGNMISGNEPVPSP